MEMNWIKEFNRMFSMINSHGTPEYFSGPKFIEIIKEFDTNFPDYIQYIQYRQEKGLSTSRKNYFYDILMLFPDATRKKIIERIIEVADGQDEGYSSTPAANHWGDDIDSSTNIILSKKVETELSAKIETDELPVSTEIIESPTVFISYSWDNEEHKNWVLGLAKKLLENGVNVLLDRYELTPGKNMFHFMETSISKSDKVIIIFTPNYKLKADKRQGGVGYEYSILNTELYKHITDNSKFIPVLKEGNNDISIPSFIQQFIAIQMTDNYRYDEKFNELLLAIYDKPLISKPPIGQRPKFS